MVANSVVAAAATTQKVVMDAYDVSTIINNINSLYSSALDQIIILTIGLLTLGGIILPMAIAYYQRLKVSTDHKALTEEIKTEIEKAKIILAAEIRGEVATEISKLDTKTIEIKNELEKHLLEVTSGLNAKAHHSQARTYVTEKRYGNAYLDCLVAISGYAIAKDETNLQTVLNSLLIDLILPKMTKNDFEVNAKVDIFLKDAIGSIESINTNGRYNKDIQALQAGVRNAKAKVG